MIKLMDFAKMFTDDYQKVFLYDVDTSEEMYLGHIGHIKDAPGMYDSYYVDSIDTLRKPSRLITLNIKKQK